MARPRVNATNRSENARGILETDTFPVLAASTVGLLGSSLGQGRLLAAPVLVLGNTEPLACAAFSPDGRRVVTAGPDNTARVWNASTGQPVTAPLTHGQVVLQAGFSPLR